MARDKVLLRCAPLGVSLTLPVWPEDSSVTLPAWTVATLDRPGRDPLALPATRTTEERALGFTLRHFDYRRSVEPMLRDLRRIARAKAACQLVMGASDLGLWRLDPPQITEVEWADDGTPSVVDVDLTLKAASDAQITVGLIRPIKGRLKNAARKKR